jgi:hypothetical protein
MPTGRCNFSVHLVEHEIHSGITVYFERNDLDKFGEELKQQGILFDSFPEDKPWPLA